MLLTIISFGGILIAYLLFFCIVFFLLCFSSLCVLYLLWPVSLSCPFLIATSVFTNVYMRKCVRYLYSGLSVVLQTIVYLTSILYYLFLFQHSDDGRRRAGVLPPLLVKKEPTFHRQPKGNTTLSNPDEVRKYNVIKR